MAEDDIYQSKRRYERIINNLDCLTTPPKNGIYFCKNKLNLKYFNDLVQYFELKDISYIRRCKVLSVLKIITFVIEKDLNEQENQT